ncbi:MAG: hypothetical protein ACXVWU_11325 [Nocardioides sp.]
MPIPPSPQGPLLRRRTALGAVLAAGAVTGLAGCTRGVDMRPAPGASLSPAPSTPTVEPDVALAGTVLAEEQAVLDRVLATLAAFPGLRGTLAGAEEAHRRHVALLKDAVPHGSGAPSAPSTTASTAAATVPSPASASASPSATPAPTGPRVPADRGRALTALARAEDALTLSAKRAAFAAESGAFARVLASMAAAAAQQAVVLRGSTKAAR